ncbi:Anaerobic nitric oxide reductase transcription regulator NorR [Sporomusa rhizae]|uniref:sigma 54-interacting transcriptional regulator n=1 Tax=Sporomusa rhizae TaxID=357999 RepID=UPI00352AEFA1
MNRIIFISTNKELSVMAQAVAEELGLTVEFYEGWLEQASKIIETLNGPPIDILMSRGGTAKFLAEKFSMPVIPVNTGPYEILAALNEARQYCRRIAITSYSDQYIGLSLMEKVLDISITEVIITDLKTLERRIASLASENYCIVGGGASVAYAQKVGLPSVFLKTNRATLQSAFLEADRLASLRREETRKSRRLEAILDATYDGIIAVDAHGEIEIFNKSAEKTLNIRATEVIGKNIAEIVPNSRLDHILQTGQSEEGELQDTGNTRILTNRVPVRYGSKIVGAVASFMESSKVVQAEHKIRKELTAQSQFKAKATFSDIIGVSKTLEIKKKIAKNFAQSYLSIMLYGASGTGKELFAQSIHNASERAKNPFVAINCGALPHTLLESELFGYEEGAFTGARRKGKHGLFELAHGGTIFLDEIDALPIEMQTRLLRVLQEREVLRIGGESIIPINIRVIAASNRSAEDLLEKNIIREDLFYRLNVLWIELPTLADRREDIKHLCEHFLPAENKHQLRPIVAKILPYFEKYTWPGNIRELQNTIQRLAFFVDSFEPEEDVKDFLRLVAPNILRAVATSFEDDISQIRPQVKEFEHELIQKAVAEHKTLEQAAAHLGIGRSTLTRKLKKIRERRLPN